MSAVVPGADVSPRPEPVRGGYALARPHEHPARAGRPSRIVLLFQLLFLASAVALLSASARHLALRASAPAQGEHLTTTPTVIRLDFTEPVETAISSVSLIDPNGAEVRLGTLTREGDGHVITVPIEGPVAAGEYRVAWQAVGLDGHPVRGEFTFVIEVGAAGRASAVAAPPDPGSVGETRPPVETPPRDEASASAQVRSSFAGNPTTLSAPYTAIRWLMYVGIVAILGALGLALVGARTSAAGADLAERLARRAAGFGLVGVLLLALSIPLRLVAQSLVLFGDGASGERIGALLGTLWGTGWLLQTAGCVIAGVGLLAARRGGRWGWGFAVLGAVMLVISPGLSGHAAAAEAPTGVAPVADALHVAGAGLWIGTLAALLFVGVPAARGIAAAESGSALSAIVRGFSRLAMVSAGMLVVTGLVGAYLQLTSPADLWTTDYGRVLAGKILVVLLVVGLGAYNWRRMRPVMDRPGADRKLRRSGGLEVAAATVAIVLTAILVALQPPAHAGTDTSVQAQSAAQP